MLMKGPGPHPTEVSKISGIDYAGACLMNLIKHMRYSLKNHRKTTSPFTTRDYELVSPIQKKLRQGTICKCTQDIFPFPKELNMEKVAVVNGLMNHKLILDTSTDRTNED